MARRKPYYSRRPPVSIDANTLVVGTRKRDRWHNPVSLTILAPSSPLTIESSRRCNTDVTVYDSIEATLASVKTSHVMFIDKDTLCLASKREIIDTFTRIYEPRLLVASTYQDGVLRYSGSMWMAELAISRLVIRQLGCIHGDDQWKHFIAGNRVCAEPDYRNLIFQRIDDSPLRLNEGRIHNIDSGTTPCLINGDVNNFAGELGYDSTQRRERSEAV